MIVIHVGLKKCGSASIQAFLSTNWKELRKTSLEYPEVGRRIRKGYYIAHHNFAHEILRSGKFGERPGTLSECAKVWAASSCRVMVISSEMFEECDTRQALEMKEKLLGAGRAEEFRIYVVIRDLVRLMPSSYAQKVKYALNNYDFDTFFEARMQQRRVNYFDTVRRWAEAFAWETMEVRVLDGGDLLNGDLIDDFLAVCGINDESAKAGLIRTGIQNSSPGWRVLEATRDLSNPPGGFRSRHPLRRWVRAKHGQPGVGKLLGECAEEAGGVRGWNSDRGRYLTRDQARRCHETYRDAVLRLNELLPRPLPMPAGLDAMGFREREFLPDASYIPQRKLSAFYDDVWDLLQKKLSNSDHPAADPVW